MRKLLTFVIGGAAVISACGGDPETPKPLFASQVTVRGPLADGISCDAPLGDNESSFTSLVWPKYADGYDWDEKDNTVPMLQFDLVLENNEASGQTASLCQAPYQVWGAREEYRQAMQTFFTSHVQFDPAQDITVVRAGDAAEEDSSQATQEWWKRANCVSDTDITAEDYVALHVNVIVGDDNFSNLGLGAEMCKVKRA